MLQVGQVFLRKGVPVFITGGRYIGTHGVSNFWYWKPINKDGSLGKEAHGYDNQEGLFKPYKGKFELKVYLTDGRMSETN